jgi:hypothetical protein
MPTYTARSVINPIYPGVAGHNLKAVDPATGESIGPAWADTEWGMLKVYVMKPDLPNGVRRVEIEHYGIKGREERGLKAVYVQRDFDLVDRRDGKVYHRIRVTNGFVRDLGPVK